MLKTLLVESPFFVITQTHSQKKHPVCFSSNTYSDEEVPVDEDDIKKVSGDEEGDIDPNLIPVDDDDDLWDDEDDFDDDDDEDDFDDDDDDDFDEDDNN
jgi:DNA-directed RNA polymerase subunit delta